MHCSGHFIGDLQFKSSEPIRKTALFRGSTHSFRRHAIGVFRLSSLSCAHVVFSGAVFRRAWFACDVQGARHWRQNRWKADRRFQDESKRRFWSPKPALCAANRRIAAVMTSGNDRPDLSSSLFPSIQSVPAYLRNSYIARCGVVNTGLQRRQVGGKIAIDCIGCRSRHSTNGRNP